MDEAKQDVQGSNRDLILSISLNFSLYVIHKTDKLGWFFMLQATTGEVNTSELILDTYTDELIHLKFVTYFFTMLGCSPSCRDC